MQKKYKIITAALAMGVCGNALAYYEVDGNLKDWLVNAPVEVTNVPDCKPGNCPDGYTEGSNYLRFEPTTDGKQTITDSNDSWKQTIGNVDPTVEDGFTREKGDGPIYGGHLYEAAAMYSAISGDTLYVAIVTGTPASLGVSGCGDDSSGCWDPGDIAIYTGDHVFDPDHDEYQFGLETTGRVGHLPGDSLFTTSDQHDGEKIFEKGTIVGGDTPAEAAVWASGIENNDGAATTALLGGKDKGKVGVELSYGDDEDLNGVDDSKFWKVDWHSDHYWDDSPDTGWKPYYVIEAAIPTAMIGLTTQNGAVHYALHWTQNCGNDGIGHGGHTNGQTVPEPGALAVMMLGLVGLGVSRRRKQTAQS